MSHLLFWPSVTYFYPIGNTSAVCLTESLPPEQSADILLLACGDPRHILYTVYVNETKLLTDPRKLDITCCDVDAAVLARNALLFTLLADIGAQDKLNNLWNIFYHMFIDQTSLSILVAQCRKLVDLAESLDTWRAGPYAHFLTTCDAATLAELRRFWTLYINNANLSPKQAKRFQQTFRDGMRDVSQKTGSANTASRSAGPLTPYAADTTGRQFDGFWSSGVTDDGSKTSTQSLSVNPTFAFSLDGSKFAVHYGTDPLSGFHLAEAFVSGKFNLSGKEIPPHELVRTAKKQFSRWCTAMIKLLSLKNDSTSSRSFVIRMFVGDALMFCQAIKYCAITKSTVTPFNVAAWRFSKIELDSYYYGPNALSSPAPKSFNVIETSNVLDHIGLVNLLVATAPLLARTPSATLYTEALLRKGSEPSRAILEHLCGDLSTMSLLLGIVPSSFVSRFATRSNIHESITMSEESKQYHERLAWRAIGQPHAPDSPPHLPSFSSDELAAFLFSVYRKMFSHEDVSLRFASLNLSPLEMMRNFERSGVLHYSRRSFALFVHHARGRVHADWTQAITLLLSLVQNDTKLLTGSNHFQELSCHLHLLGIHTPEWMTIPRVRGPHRENPAPFRDWTNVPQVVTIVLVVPRDVISQLEPEFRECGTPIFLCDILAGHLHNCFGAISATFGKLETTGTGEHKTGIVRVIDDNDNLKASPPWSSKSPLIATFSVPASAVILSAIEAGLDGVTVGLTLLPAPAVAAKFMGKLGLMLTMYRAKLGDGEHVQVLAQRPMVRTETSSPTPSSSPGVGGHAGATVTLKLPALDVDVTKSPHMQVKMNDSVSTIKSFTVRLDIMDSEASAALADPQTPISVSPVSMHVGCLKIGVHTRTVTFPLPVDFDSAKLRLARKSSYVEIVAPLLPLDVKGERDVSRKFHSLLEDGSPTLGSIHRVYLDRCPLLKLPQAASSMTWFFLHTMLMFSDREKQTMTGEIKDVPDTLLDVKRTLHGLMLAAIGGPEGNAPLQTMFTLYDTVRQVDYLHIIAAGVRLDLASHTVVVDAFVAPSSDAVRNAFGLAVRASIVRGANPRVLQIQADADEAVAWRHLLPLLIERCRTWEHKPTCIYRTKGLPVEGPIVPALPDDEVWESRSPVCGCGVGVGTEVLPVQFKPLAPYLVRAAFSPLFFVTYLEESMTSIIPREPERMASGSQTRSKADEGVSIRCRSCGKKPNGQGTGLLACSRCKNAKYCSKECQRKDWKLHRKVCKINV